MSDAAASRPPAGAGAPVVRFAAPWGLMLRSATALATLVLFGMPFAMWHAAPGRESSAVPLAFFAAAIVLIGVASLFMIRGYRLDAAGLHVERLLWADRIALDGLRGAWADHQATARSLRLFGNSGFFCIAGLFSNRKLGRYRAFATDPQRAVVLDLAPRKIVVTPDDPWAFLDALRHRFPQVEIGVKPYA
ncbi:MAG: PH domain-containing protein [Burkholderiales bacterium]|nr:PH domain-containing protein [Burkholderiales bacterium]